MKRIGSCFAVTCLVAFVWTVAALGQASTSAPLTVGQLLADPDKFVGAEIVVRGHIEISDLWRAMEAVHNLYDSKAVVDQLGKDWKVITYASKPGRKSDKKAQDKAGDAGQDMNELERKYCLAVAPVQPFLRDGKYLTGTSVTIRGRLERLDGHAFNGCNANSGLALQVDEVLDPPLPAAKPKR